MVPDCRSYGVLAVATPIGKQQMNRQRLAGDGGDLLLLNVGDKKRV
jgi:hypothetical protein